jgi:hypothetical protein
MEEAGWMSGIRTSAGGAVVLLAFWIDYVRALCVQKDGVWVLTSLPSVRIHVCLLFVP